MAANYLVVGDKVIHMMFGLYLWEWFTSLNFDWQLISGKKRFKWPLTFYFLNRYAMLICAISYLILWDVQNPSVHIDCKFLFALVHLCGSGSLGLASANLAIRTIAIWNQNIYVIIGLTILLLAHLGLVIADTADATKTAELQVYGSDTAGCVNASTGDWLRIIVSATLIIDFVVLVLNIYKILQTSKAVYGDATLFKYRKQGFFKLSYIVLKQGVVYFLLAFSSNAAQIVILSIPALRPTGMNRIFILPSYIIATIVACRAVRDLTNFIYDGSEIHVVSTTRSGISGNRRLNPARSDVKSSPIRFALETEQDGVLVQMETISRNDSLHVKSPIV
ncbi:hypothetical protein CPB83DRAFT_907308 [Crepidotus variabilis]|uniref:Uncharacterized protein n=1 Tax=Crepidotus variabilis TaxID=179855 RepID=A0A9P6EF52_9AGAR|nr:hypothetical protein CPB83DRAFT_907308 [Crepidotus variabilis]